MKLSALTHFFRQQIIYVSLSAVLVGVFWAIGEPTSPALVLVYTLCIGNLLSFAIGRLEFLYSAREFPYNLLVFLPVLLVLTVPIYLISTTVVWLIARPTSLTLVGMLRMEWRFPFLVTLVFGILSFLYHSTKERLEQRNVELQQSVESGAARLEMQEQELAREILDLRWAREKVSEETPSEPKDSP